MTSAEPIELALPTYGQLFADRRFAGLVGAATANVLGASLQILALSVLVYARTGSALWSSATFAAGFLPQLLGGALLTSLADRWRARPLLAVAALLRAATAALLATADLSPAIAVAVVAVVAVFAPVPAAAQAALVARLLSGDLYVLGRSVFSLLSSGAQLAGLAIGGAIVGLLGARTAIGVSAAIQLAGLVGIAALPRALPKAGHDLPWRLTETWRANANLLATPAVRRILLSWWIPITLLVGAESLIVAYVAEANLPTWTTGLLYGAFPAGAAIGDLVIGRWCSPRTCERLAPVLLALLGAGLLPLALHPPVAVAVMSMVGASVGTAYQLGGQRAFLAAVPVNRQGVALGLANTGIQTGQGIGPVVAGALAQATGVGLTISALGAVILLVTLWLGQVRAAE